MQERLEAGDTYDKLDFDRERRLPEDPDYGPASLAKGQKVAEEEDRCLYNNFIIYTEKSLFRSVLTVTV